MTRKLILAALLTAGTLHGAIKKAAQQKPAAAAGCSGIAGRRRS